MVTDAKHAFQKHPYASCTKELDIFWQQHAYLHNGEHGIVGDAVPHAMLKHLLTWKC
jgi:hypothetical protein